MWLDSLFAPSRYSTIFFLKDTYSIHNFLFVFNIFLKKGSLSLIQFDKEPILYNIFNRYNISFLLGTQNRMLSLFLVFS